MPIMQILCVSHEDQTMLLASDKQDLILTVSLNHCHWYAWKVPYILAYKSQNLQQNLDLKVGGATYMRVIK